MFFGVIQAEGPDSCTVLYIDVQNIKIVRIQAEGLTAVLYIDVQNIKIVRIQAEGLTAVETWVVSCIIHVFGVLGTI